MLSDSNKQKGDFKDRRARSHKNVGRSTVYLVDDHPLVREALPILIGQEKDLTVIGSAGDIDKGLKEIISKKPDVVIVDLCLGEGLGLHLIEELHRSIPAAKVLVFSMLEERLYAERCLKAGAHGYLMKSEPTGHLIGAIRKVLSGSIAVTDNITNVLLKGMASNGFRPDTPLAKLSNQEMEVFRLIGNGVSPQNIAKKMCRSVKTIHTYIERIKKKVDCQDYRKLIVMACRMITVPCQKERSN